MKGQLLSTVTKGGLMAAVLALALPDVSWAGVTNLEQSISQVTLGMTNMPIVLSGCAYLAAGATMIHGCGLLKKHADNPTGQPLAAGLTRVLAGGFVAALPWAISWAVTTFQWGKEGASPFPFIPFADNAGNFFNTVPTP